MKYLTAQDILIIHAKIIEETGGLHGVRDVGLLISLTERPKAGFGGKELYRGVFKKAAVYLESLAHYHVFIDGNKRTGITASARFLFLNDSELSASNKELEQFVLEVVVKKLDLETIANWLKKHSKKKEARQTTRQDN